MIWVRELGWARGELECNNKRSLTVKISALSALSWLYAVAYDLPLPRLLGLSSNASFIQHGSPSHSVLEAISCSTALRQRQT